MYVMTIWVLTSTEYNAVYYWYIKLGKYISSVFYLYYCVILTKTEYLTYKMGSKEQGTSVITVRP